MEEKIKHLEFTQSIITRMNSNSFSIKGWTITLVSALFALAATNSNQSFFIIAYIPAIIFWGLDSYYLAQERQYRKLYKKIADKDKDAAIDFSLDASSFNEAENSWTSCLISNTIIGFYLPLILLMAIIMYCR